MRLSRLVAVFAAVALGFGGAVAAASPASAAPPTPNPVQVTGVAISEAAIGSSTSVYAKTAVTVNAHPTATSWYAYADVYVNGVLRAGDRMIASNSASLSTYWPRAAGTGTVQLRNLRVTSYGSGWSATKVAQAAVSNVAPVRSTVYFLAGLRINKKGTKLTAKAQKMKYYRADGSFASLGKVALQRFKKGKWRGFKKIKLNAAGNGKIKFKQSKKMKYRLFVPTTASLYGGYTKGTKKIRVAP